VEFRGLLASVAIFAALRCGGAADAGCSGVIHRLSHSPQHSDLVLNLPVGVALVSPSADPYALAAAYRAGAGSKSGKRSIVAAGPLLDSPDELLIQECRREGRRIVVQIVHTSARLSGKPLRRNLPYRPLLEIPASFEPGRYTVEVRWEALESLPSGKPLAAAVVAGPAEITL
jgi:hypothetical protein